MPEVVEMTIQSQRRPWTPPHLEFDGDLRDLVLAGGGKLSSSPSDPGEARKTSPTG